MTCSSRALIPAIISSTFFLANLYITSAFSPSASAATASASAGFTGSAPGANPAPPDFFVLLALTVPLAGVVAFPAGAVAFAALLPFAGAVALAALLAFAGAVALAALLAFAGAEVFF